MLNKKGLLKMAFVIVIIIIILILYLKMTKAATAVDIVNVTLKVNATDILLNFSGTIYAYSNVNTSNFTNFTFSLQQNFNVFIESNVTNVTTNITVNNSSVSVSCSCPASVVCPSVNCNITDVSLNNATKTEFYNHYVTQLSGKIEESSSKVAQDVIFQLQPTKAQIDDCRQSAFNSSIKQNQAERQRDEQLKNNQVITGYYDSCNSEKRTLQAVFMGFIVIVVFIVMFFMGFFERFGMFFGGGRF